MALRWELECNRLFSPAVLYPHIESNQKRMKKQIASLAIILLVSTAYAISAAKRLGFWGLAFFVFVWVAVFSWARSRKKL